MFRAQEATGPAIALFGLWSASYGALVVALIWIGLSL